MKLPRHQWAGRGPRALALHGFTGGGEDFAALADPLGRALCAPDLPGHAAAAALPCALPALVAALGELSADAPILLGYSMGGRIALHLALAHPPRALVLVGASPGLATEAARAARRSSDEALAIEVTEMGAAAFAERWAAVPLIASQARIPEPYRSAMTARRRENDPEGLARALRGLGAGALPSLWERLSELSCPTLLMVGEEDEKYRAIAEQMQARLADAALCVLPNAGHCAHLERPEAAAEAIDRFLRGAL